jgi:hypothetical protein
MRVIEPFAVREKHLADALIDADAFGGRLSLGVSPERMMSVS